MSDKEKTKPLEKIDDLELDEIVGGSISNVQYTKTVDISKDTKNKA